MIQTSTYHELFKIIGDIKLQTLQHASFHVLNKTRIDWFNKQNGPRIDAMNQYNAELIKRHAKHDENGRPMLIIAENGQQALSFDSDEKKEEYTKEFWEFMNRSIDLHL